MLILWVVSFWPFDDRVAANGAPFFADFGQFHVAGEKVGQGDFATLYDNADNQRRIVQTLPELPADFALPFRYPPHVAILFAPLGHLSYVGAATLFSLVSLAFLLATAVLLRREFTCLQHPTSLAYFAMALSFPLVLETWIGGQLSTFGLAIVAVAITLFRHQRPFSAGLALGLLCYKPNVALLFGLGCCLRYPKSIPGVLLTGASVLGLTVAVVGLDPVSDYISVATSLASGPWDLATPTWKVHGLGPWLNIVWPGHGNQASLSLGVATLIAWVVVWRRRQVDNTIGFAGLLVINGLFGVYTPIYDLLLLGLAWVCVAEWSASHAPDFGETRPAIIATYLLWFGPHLSQLTAMEIGFQPFAILAVAIAVALVVGRSRVGSSVRLGARSLEV
jgi:hypothetical protein